MRITLVDVAVSVIVGLLLGPLLGVMVFIGFVLFVAYNRKSH